MSLSNITYLQNRTKKGSEWLKGLSWFDVLMTSVWGKECSKVVLQNVYLKKSFRCGLRSDFQKGVKNCYLPVWINSLLIHIQIVQTGSKAIKLNFRNSHRKWLFYKNWERSKSYTNFVSFPVEHPVNFLVRKVLLKTDSCKIFNNC